MFDVLLSQQKKEEEIFKQLSSYWQILKGFPQQLVAKLINLKKKRQNPLTLHLYEA